MTAPPALPSIDAVGLIAAILTVSPAIGMALLLSAFIWPRVSPLFHVMMLCFREG